MIKSFAKLTYLFSEFSFEASPSRLKDLTQLVSLQHNDPQAKTNTRIVW